MNKNKDICFLKKIVEAYSPYGQERGVAEIILKEMKKRGFKARIDRTGNVIGEIGKGKRQILFVGHMDVYPGGIPVRIEKGKLFGRGSVDAKGSLAAFIAAASQLPEEVLKEKKIIVASCVEEEGPSSKGARNLMKATKYKPEFVIIGEPSGWDNVTLGYRGILSFDLSYEQDNFHYGSNGNDRVTDMTVRFCERLLDKVNHLKDETSFHSPSVEIREINSSNDGIREKCQAGIVIRIPPRFQLKKLKSWLETNTKGKLDFTQSDPSVLADLNTELVRVFRRVIKKHRGQAVLMKKLGTSDMNIIAPFYKVPIVAYGPGNSKLDHTPQEHLKLKDYLKSVEVLREVLRFL